MAGRLNGNDVDNDSSPIAEINIVPFVDIILVVLIIFMITTPFLVKPSIPINLPKAASGEDTQPSELNISIALDGPVLLNGKAVSDEELKRLAAEALLRRTDTQAIIAADEKVPHGRVIGILDIIKSSGITKFAISIEKGP